LRAYLVVHNGARASKVSVDASGFLRPGEAYRLLNPKDPFGDPVLEGASEGTTLDVPLAGGFAAFVVLKGKGKP
jgi:hypothetical protein